MRRKRINKPLPTWQELQVAENRPLESYRMVFLDTSEYDGESNIKYVEEPKRQNPITPDESWPVLFGTGDSNKLEGLVEMFHYPKNYIEEAGKMPKMGEGLLAQIHSLTGTYHELKTKTFEEAVKKMMEYITIRTIAAIGYTKDEANRMSVLRSDIKYISVMSVHSTRGIRFDSYITHSRIADNLAKEIQDIINKHHKIS